MSDNEGDTQEHPEPPEAPPTFEPREGLRVGLPWERLEPGMTPGALMASARLVLFTPTDAFRMMRLEGVLTAPFVFLVALGTLGTFFGLIWQSWSRAIMGTIGGSDFVGLLGTNTLGVMSFVLAPFFVVLGALIATAIHHVFLLLFGGAPQPPEVTLRVVCYAWGANYLWMMLPLCGGIIGTIWCVVATIVGLREAHGVPGGRAAAAVLVPYLIVACCLMMLLPVLAASTIAALQ